jgi:hypothetical protein
MREWTVLFCSGVPLKQQYTLPIDQEVVAIATDADTNEQLSPNPSDHGTVSVATLRGVNSLDEYEFMDYLEAKHSWRDAGEL